MPVMDGFTVLAEMNKAHYIENIPVVTISVDASDNNSCRRLQSCRHATTERRTMTATVLGAVASAKSHIVVSHAEMGSHKEAGIAG